MRYDRAALVLLSSVISGIGAAQVGAPGTPVRGAPQMPREAGAPLPPPSLGAGATGSVLPGVPPQYTGGVPSGPATPEVLPLSLSDAIARGFKYNLGLLLSEQGTRAATASRLLALSGLLPTVTTRTTETSEQVNLAALGFSGFPGIPQIIGPFSVFDTRGYVSQEVLNFSNINNARAGRERERAARYSYQDARDIVTLVVADLYLLSTAGSARIDAAQAQLRTAQTLYDRAVDLKKAGVVPGIEVLRAQVELQAQQQRLIFFQNEFAKQKLNLARAIGLPLGQQFRLTSGVPYTPPPPITFEEARRQAYQSRSDYQSALAQVRAAEAAKRAAQAQRWPSVTFDGNYGDIGHSLPSSHGTYTVQAGLNIPIFQAGRVRAEVLQSDAVLQQRRAEVENLRAGIDYELRTAFLDLKAAGDQVTVAASAQKLAGEQLTQAQDRFSAGVANNLEVVQAQEAVATANENYISSLYQYNVAKASLARALGIAEKAAKQFLEGTP